MEMAVALDRATRDAGFRVFPVLLPGLDRFDPDTLPPFLRTRTWVDLRRGPDSTRALDDLARAVRGLPFGPHVGEPLPGRCPYRGLQSFDEEHAELFYGRDRDVQRLVEQLKAGRFLAVVGPSGSGKSSLVRAGVIPALRAGALPGSERWSFIVLRPGAEPLTALAARLLDVAGEASMHSTVDALADEARTLHLCASRALAQADPLTRMVLVIDQFEEIFTLGDDEHARRAFLDNLVYASTVPGGRSVVVVTMRADLYGRLASYPTTAQLAAAHHSLVGPLDEDGLRDAIEQPARTVGLDLEPGLADVILEDFAHEPGGLPLLEHALLETWNCHRGGILTLADYRDSGGVSHALAERAEAAYAELPEPRRRLARRILLRLTRPGEEAEDTRRRASLEELVTDAAERPEVEAVVRELAGARLLTVGGDAADGTSVDVAHEALIRGWPRLRSWIEDERRDLLVHRRLTDAARDWAAAGRDRSALLRGRRLDEALAWRTETREALNDAERSFLAASTRIRRVRRGVAVVAVALLLGAAVAAAVPQIREAGWQREARGPMAPFAAGPAILGGSGEPDHRRGTDGRPRRVQPGPLRGHQRAVPALHPRRAVSRSGGAGERRAAVQAPRCAAAGRQRHGAAGGRVLPLARAAAADGGGVGTGGARNPREAAGRGATRARRRASCAPRSAPASRDRSRASTIRRSGSGEAPGRIAHMVGNVREFTSTPLHCKPDPYRCADSVGRPRGPGVAHQPRHRARGAAPTGDGRRRRRPGCRHHQEREPRLQMRTIRVKEE